MPRSTSYLDDDDGDKDGGDVHGNNDHETCLPLLERRKAEERRASAEDAERARAASHTAEMLLLNSSVEPKRDEVHDRAKAERYDKTVKPGEASIL